MRFEYFINLDERGEFYADVRDEDGKTVLELHSDDEGVVDLLETGWMRHKTDLHGLKGYLVEQGIMQPSDELIKAN
jgi:hypothetical protein